MYHGPTLLKVLTSGGWITPLNRFNASTL